MVIKIIKLLIIPALSQEKKKKKKLQKKNTSQILQPEMTFYVYGCLISIIQSVQTKMSHIQSFSITLPQNQQNISLHEHRTQGARCL